MTPETLGPYRIDREIGVGGMGKVYAATLTREAAGLAPGTTVALKVVHPHLLETEGFFRRFLREADIGVSVRHENVVRTYLTDALSGRHFLVEFGTPGPFRTSSLGQVAGEGLRESSCVGGLASVGCGSSVSR